MLSRRSGKTSGLVRTATRLVLVALAPCLLVAAPGRTQTPTSRAEARAQLERACVDGGAEPAGCACSTGVLDENLTERELAAVALMFADPLGAADPGVAIATLLSAGYTLDEITTVMERIVALEGEADAACAPPADPADPE
jgi:hypothetical protein